jgi:photosystem II stability/assembly factor-like uncharacterized protein
MKKLAVTSIALLCASIAFTQKATKKTPHASAPAEASDQRVKAIWEPINYPEDLELNDVFFVTDQEGWITGGRNEMHGGVILHTADGGDHWDVQVGDPESSDRAFKRLRFIDPTHGWATQEDRLLHTTDGQHWQVVGTMEHRSADYQFISDSDGFRVYGNTLFATHDGGRSWQPAAGCHARVQVEGLTRDVTCQWVRLQFLTPQIGYAVAKAQGLFDRARAIHLDQAFIARTDDGGATWSMHTAQVTGDPEDAFFIDDRTGYLRTGGPETGQLFKTIDGGVTWSGMATSPGNRIAFADPQVGWSILYNKVSFTNDGGDRWSSRQYPFPTPVNAFSLPRRDRGYVVGKHGMIYRYRVAPVSFAAKGMIEAPRLTPIDFTVPQEFQQLNAQVASLQPKVTPPSNDATTTVASAATTTEAPAAIPQQLATVETTLNTVVAQTPLFVSRYRNLNLLMVGTQMTSLLPQQILDLKQSFSTLRAGKDPQSRATALSDFSTKLQGVIAFMDTNFHSPALARVKK